MGRSLNTNTNTNKNQKSQVVLSSDSPKSLTLSDSSSTTTSVTAAGANSSSDCDNGPVLTPTSWIRKLTKNQNAVRKSKEARLNGVVKTIQIREVISTPARRAKARAVRSLAAQFDLEIKSTGQRRKNVVNFQENITQVGIPDAVNAGKEPSFVAVRSNIDAPPPPPPVQPSIPSRHDRSKPTALERITLSLLAPLPNEHQFALNVCLVMSIAMKKIIAPDLKNDPPVPASSSPPNENFDCFLQFREYPALLDALLGHLGVFHDCGLRELFVDIGIGQELNHVLIWADILKRAPEAVKHLHCEFYSRQPPVHEIIGHVKKRPVCCRLCVICSTQADDGSEEEEEYNGFVNPPQTTEGVDWFADIALILKAASVGEANARLMANHTTLKRFLLLAIHSSSVQLAEVATIILSHIAPFMKLFPPDQDPMTAILMNFVKAGLWSDDRFQILYCMNILSELVAHNDAKSLCWESVGTNLANRILEILLLNDVHLLVTTFKCLLEITRRPLYCGQFAMCTGFTKALVRFLSYEIRADETKSFGIRITAEDKALLEKITLGSFSGGPKQPAPVSQYNPPPILQSAAATAAQRAVLTLPSTRIFLITPRPQQFQFEGISEEVKRPLLANGSLNSVTTKGAVYSCPKTMDGDTEYYAWKHEPFEGCGQSVTYFDDMSQPFEIRVPLPLPEVPGRLSTYWTVWRKNPEVKFLVNYSRDRCGQMIPFLGALAQPGLPECEVRRPHNASDNDWPPPRRWTRWIRVTSACVLNALAVNSWRARESLRTNHYSSLVELQMIAREMNEEYQDLMDKLVEVLETEEKAFYHLAAD